jgi:hypothetical protein
VADSGVELVVLATVYHAARAATPLHPAHQLVDAPNTAFYRPSRPSVWTGRRLVPHTPQWMDRPDSFDAAAETLHREGIPLSAWIVLAHDSRIGAAHPELAVVNCFGDRYRYALCPQHAEVRDYLATLAAEAVRDAPIAAVSLEACGQLGLTHLGTHEKTDGAWTATGERLLSVCCCSACQREWSGAGLDPAEVIRALRAAVHNGQSRSDDAWSALCAVRHAGTDALRRQVLEALREAAPGVPVTLHAHPDPWVTGPSPGLTPTAAEEVDALLVQCWPTGPASADLVTRAAATGRPVDAYVTVLPPADPDELAAHVRRLVDAGASRLSLYHLGLAPAWRQRLFAEISRLVRG